MVERGGLENRCGCKPTQGSNPCLSATIPLKLEDNSCVSGRSVLSAIGDIFSQKCHTMAPFGPSGYADYAPLGRFLCPFPPLTALSNHEKRDPAITGSLPHFTWRFLSKSVVTICGNSGLLFFCKIPEIVPFSCQRRSMADVFLDAIDMWRALATGLPEWIPIWRQL